MTVLFCQVHMFEFALVFLRSCISCILCNYLFVSFFYNNPVVFVSFIISVIAHCYYWKQNVHLYY